jgi:hypothetical protein
MRQTNIPSQSAERRTVKTYNGIIVPKQNAIRYALGLPGYCSAEKAAYLYDLALSVTQTVDQPLVVEVGVLGGRSLFPMAFALAAVGRGRVIGVDRWRANDCDPLDGIAGPDFRYWERVDWTRLKECVFASVYTFGLQDYVDIREMLSVEAAALVEPNSVSIMHIDGNHCGTSVREDLAMWYPRIAERGFLVLDDTDFPGVQTSLDWVRARFRLVHDRGGWQVYEKATMA